MTDFIISTPAYLDSSKQAMQEETLQVCFEKLAGNKHSEVYCHGDWAASTSLLKSVITKIEGAVSGVLFCLHKKDDPKSVVAILPEDIKLEVALDDLGSNTCLEALQGRKNVGFFVPLKSPGEGKEIIQDALSVYSNPNRIRLGVGWQNRLSGPSQITEEDYEKWATSIVDLVELITHHSEEIGEHIKIEFGCGLKLCMFEKEQLGEMAQRSLKWPIATCPRPFLVREDGELKPCVRLGMPDSVRLDDETNLNNEFERLGKWLSPYTGHCSDAETLYCRCLKVHSCVTGCLEHRLNEWDS